jgi:hypothetical protein
MAQITNNIRQSIIFNTGTQRTPQHQQKHITLYTYLHNLLNILPQVANKMGL